MYVAAKHAPPKEDRVYSEPMAIGSLFWRSFGTLQAVACAVAGLGSAAVWAECSRVIVVPAAPTGFNVKVVDDVATGVYPDWLREMGRKAGCQFQFPVVPRARADSMLFVSNQSDMLLPASQNAERDQKAQFVHVVNLTPSLITLNNAPNVPRDVRTLLSKTAMRAALVRSYSWGNEYDTLVRELVAENRVDFVTDLETIGRMLRLGRADFTILPPHAAVFRLTACFCGHPDGRVPLHRAGRLAALQGGGLPVAPNPGPGRPGRAERPHGPGLERR
jgi:polar amino acid transport system substrate-binding protein